VPVSLSNFETLSKNSKNRLSLLELFVQLFSKGFKMKLDNLLLVAGSGRNSGKTTIVCKIIKKFQHLGIISVKISPHFHDPSDGLIYYSGKSGFEIYEETNRNTQKDSSRMLQSGAEKVYYLQTKGNNLNEAFSDIYMNIVKGKPVVCESPSLISYIQPGLFIIMISPAGNNLKNIGSLRRFPHIEYTYEEILKTNNIPIDFFEGKWRCLK
jgi:hypothetical protein